MAKVIFTLLCFSLLAIVLPAQVISNHSDISLESSIYGVEYYNYISELNSKSEKVFSRKKFTYQLDSIFSFKPKRQQNGDDYSLSRNYRYPSRERKEIEFLRSCTGEDCVLTADTYAIRDYDSSGRIVSRVGTLWGGENYDYDCALSSTTRYSYLNDLLVSISWPETKDTFLYDQDKKLIQITRSILVNGQDTFRDDTHIYYRYNQFDQLEIILETDYRTNLNAFIPVDSIHRSYYSSGELYKEEKFFIVEVFPSKWEGYDLREYTYNINGSLNEIRTYNIFDSNVEEWNQRELVVYEYLAEGDLDNITYYDVRDTINIREIFRKEYEYNTSIDLVDVLLPKHLDTLHYQLHMLTGENNYEIGSYPYRQGQEKVPCTREYYYKQFDGVSTDQLDIESPHFTLVPNPSTNIIRVNSANINTASRYIIYDLRGRPHIKSMIDESKAIDISNLKSGKYILQIFYNGEVGSCEFVKI